MPGGQILTQQEPPFDEKDFSKYINAMLAGKPDGLFTAFFGPFIVPFWKQWKATGNDKNTRIICGLGILATFARDEERRRHPGQHLLLQPGAVRSCSARRRPASSLCECYLAKYGSQHPIVSEFAFQIFSSLQMAKALIEKTKSVDPKAWRKIVETGKFTYQGPYHSGPTYVNPINHMSDTCASVGKIVWKPSAKIHATYDPSTYDHELHAQRPSGGAGEAADEEPRRPGGGDQVLLLAREGGQLDDKTTNST